MEYIREGLGRSGEREGKYRYDSRAADGVTLNLLVPLWRNTEQNNILEENNL